MNLPVFLLTCAVMASEPTSGVISKSASPNGSFNVVAESRDGIIFYHVEAKDGRPATADFASDFRMKRSLAIALDHTPVFWRSDSQYLILATGHDRIHEDFLILHKNATGFVALPFDWEKTWRSTRIDLRGFGYPAFRQWLSDNRIEITILRWDGRNDYRTGDFILSLTDNLNVLAWTIAKQEKP